MEQRNILLDLMKFAPLPRPKQLKFGVPAGNPGVTRGGYGAVGGDPLRGGVRRTHLRSPRAPVPAQGCRIDFGCGNWISNFGDFVILPAHSPPAQTIAPPTQRRMAAAYRVL